MSLVALVSGREVRAPSPGWYRASVTSGHLVVARDPIGELEVLGRVVRLTAPEIHGLVELPPGPALARRAVAYGDVLFTVSNDLALAPAVPVAAPTAVAHGLVFRAPTSGRFYNRPAPDKPPFCAAGTELAAGATVCLLEVMKTFHRVHYGGADVPPRARVRDVLVADGADVNAGDPLLALEAF